MTTSLGEGKLRIEICWTSDKKWSCVTPCLCGRIVNTHTHTHTHAHTRVYIYIYIYIYIIFFVVGLKREKRNISKWIGPRRYLYFLKNHLFCPYICICFQLAVFVWEHVTQGHVNWPPNETRNIYLLRYGVASVSLQSNDQNAYILEKSYFST